MIRVLIVDDSSVLRLALRYHLGQDPDIEVIGEVSDGAQAVAFVARNRPDVVTMDLNMPVMDGFAATAQIMQSNPVPIVILASDWDDTDPQKTFRAMEAGAVSCLRKPAGASLTGTDAPWHQLVQTVKAMSEVRVVKRRPASASGAASVPLASAPPLRQPGSSSIRVVALGASTGGPLAFKEVLSALPATFPVPILAVQHIAEGFTEGMIRWLDSACALQIRIAESGIRPQPGFVYFAPEGRHLEMASNGALFLDDSPPDSGLRPSVAHLFASVARTAGSASIAVLMTGMGADGAVELKLIKDMGGLTLAQDEASSVVFGMPGVAVAMGAACRVLPLDQIASVLINAVGKSVVVPD